MGTNPGGVLPDKTVPPIQVAFSACSVGQHHLSIRGTQGKDILKKPKYPTIEDGFINGGPSTP